MWSIDPPTSSFYLVRPYLDITEPHGCSRFLLFGSGLGGLVDTEQSSLVILIFTIL